MRASSSIRWFVLFALAALVFTYAAATHDRELVHAIVRLLEGPPGLALVGGIALARVLGATLPASNARRLGRGGDRRP